MCDLPHLSSFNIPTSLNFLYVPTKIIYENSKVNEIRISKLNVEIYQIILSSK